MKGNVIVGINSGLNLPNDSENVVILGDNILDLTPGQPDVVYLGFNVAIGKTIGGKKCNMYDIITGYKDQSERV